MCVLSCPGESPDCRDWPLPLHNRFLPGESFPHGAQIPGPLADRFAFLPKLGARTGISLLSAHIERIAGIALVGASG